MFQDWSKTNQSRYQRNLSGILTDGGTFLGTSRDSIQSYPLNDGSTADRTDQAIETYKKHKLDALVCLGGHETQITAHHLQKTV